MQAEKKGVGGKRKRNFEKKRKKKTPQGPFEKVDKSMLTHPLMKKKVC